MFTERLQADEREALLELLAYITAVDGEVTADEVAFVADASRRLDVRQPEVFDAIDKNSLESICRRFDRRKAQAIALAELINLGHADGHYGEAEQRGVRVIADLMGADPVLVEGLEGWVASGVEWQREGRRLMSLD